jgi:hypothetical protein
VGIGDLLEERLIHVHGHTYGMHGYILVVPQVEPRSGPELALLVPALLALRRRRAEHTRALRPLTCFSFFRRGRGSREILSRQPPIGLRRGPTVPVDAGGEDEDELHPRERRRCPRPRGSIAPCSVCGTSVSSG